jgi:hypothetical protein
MNWGAGWEGPMKSGESPFTMNHTFKKEGTYQVRATAGCIWRTPTGNPVFQAGIISATLVVEVKGGSPGCPVGFWDVTMRDVNPFWAEYPWDEVWEFKEDSTWEKWKWQAGCAWEGTWEFKDGNLLMVDEPGRFPDCEYTVTRLNETCTDMEGTRSEKYQGPPNRETIQIWTAKKRP